MSDRDRGVNRGGRQTHTLAVALACLVLVVAAVGPSLVAARPANQIPVEEVRTEEAPGEPTGEAWDTAPAVTMPLASAPSGLPNASDTSVEQLKVQATRTESRFYLRLSWADATADEATDDPREFADAAAVQLPVNESARPPIAMGGSRNLVNVWYWHADGETEELLAGGAGTTTEFAESDVAAAARHDDGRWHVVLSRAVTATGENRTTFAVEEDLDVAFAVWNGSAMERSGRKSVSEWYHFPLGPGPQGPPYETILWTVAGLAIAGVALVTIEAVRKT